MATKVDDKEINYKTPMDMFEHFPVELRENILMKLGVADLICCSRVSSVWRSRVNSNVIWKRHSRRYLFTEAIMEKYKAALFHKFNYDPDSSRLEPLCRWRLVYCVNMALMQRWRDGRWVKSVMKKAPQAYCLDCDEEHLVSGHEDGSIYVWSVHLLKWKEDKNEFNLRTKMCLLKGTPVTTVKICKEYVLALQKQLLQVYKIVNENLKMVGACCYELGEKNMDLLSHAKRLGDKFDLWYKECLRNYDIYPTRKLKFLAYNNVCFASMGGSEAVDIWTIEGLPKAYLTGFLNVRSIVENCGEVYVVSGNNPTVVSRYSWKGNEAERVISVIGFKKIVLGEEYILAIPHPSDMKMNMLWVWDKNYKLVRTKVLTSAIVSAVSISVVIYTENSQVTVWDPKSDNELKTFNVGASVGFMRHAHSTILVLFVNASLDVWDFSKGKPLRRLYSRLEWSGDFRDLLWLNPSTIIAGGVSNNIQLLRYFDFI